MRHYRYHQVAATMLEHAVDDLPADLTEELDRVAWLVERANPDGELRSVQVIAVIVSDYLRRKLAD